MRRRIAITFAPLLRWFQALSNSLGHAWRRSLQLRVVVSTLTLSLIVITILGVVLTSQITDRLLEAKISAAIEEMDRARNQVQAQLAGADEGSTLRGRLEGARSALSNRESDPGQSAGAAGTFDSVLIVPGDRSRATVATGPDDQIPGALRRFVQQGQVSYQFATVSDPDGYRGPALIVGSPTASDLSTLELYLVFPLASEDRSLALMRGTMLIGGAVLLVLLAAISMLVSRQVVLPIRSASRIAVRFADGRLKERMPVRGEDDMARLAMSFNEMAEKSVETDHPTRGVRQSAAPIHLRRQPRVADPVDDGPHGSGPHSRRQRRTRSRTAAVVGAPRHRARPIRGLAERPARDQ